MANQDRTSEQFIQMVNQMTGIGFNYDELLMIADSQDNLANVTREDW